MSSPFHTRVRRWKETKSRTQRLTAGGGVAPRVGSQLTNPRGLPPKKKKTGDAPLASFFAARTPDSLRVPVEGEGERGRETIQLAALRVQGYETAEASRREPYCCW